MPNATAGFLLLTKRVRLRICHSSAKVRSGALMMVIWSMRILLTS